MTSTNTDTLTRVIDGVDHVWEDCHRCGGSGHYSYNPMYGTTCFQCAGELDRDTDRSGRWVTAADLDRRAARRKSDGERRARKRAEFVAGAPARWNALVDAHPLLAELSYRANQDRGHGLNAAYDGILGDMLGRFERKGTLTAAQIAYAERLIRADMAAQADADDAPATVPAPTGAHTVTGTVLSIKAHRDGGDAMIIAVRQGWRLWVRVPFDAPAITVDAVVSLTAHIVPSDSDPAFAFGRRTRIVEVIPA